MGRGGRRGATGLLRAGGLFHFFVRFRVACVVPHCSGASSSSRWSDCVRARVGSPVAHWPGWSGGRCPYPGVVLSRPACGEGGL